MVFMAGVQGEILVSTLMDAEEVAPGRVRRS
jgi:hypothetical protein